MLVAGELWQLVFDGITPVGAYTADTPLPDPSGLGPMVPCVPTAVVPNWADDDCNGIVDDTADTDGDGVADKITVFAEGFNTPVSGIAAGVLLVFGLLVIPAVASLMATSGVFAPAAKTTKPKFRPRAKTLKPRQTRAQRNDTF